MALRLPVAMPNRIAAEARTAGSNLLETGGFILGEHGAPASVLALTGDVGITRARDRFQIGGLALAALFEWATDRDLTVSIQWHTHRSGAFLSETDLKYGFNVPRFTSAVVPYYRWASPDIGRWGWWTFDGRQWASAPRPGLVAAAFSVITFEEGHVREH